MKIFNKKKIKISKYYSKVIQLFGIDVVRICTFNMGKKVEILGYCVYKKRNEELPFFITEKNMDSKIKNISAMKSNASHTEVWFDHDLGGGTELYTLNKIQELTTHTLFIRIQNKFYSDYLVTLYFQNTITYFVVSKRSILEKFILKIIPDKIVVNNIALYKEPYAILQFINSFKSVLPVHVVYKTHDYQSICPNNNMVDASNQYCMCKNLEKCYLCNVPISIKDIQERHNAWRYFFENTVDDIFVFSKSSKDILTSLFSIPNYKISIHPHTVQPLRHVTITQHESINIGVLGTGSIAKGSLLVKEMVSLLPPDNSIVIKNIGPNEILKNTSVQVLGLYDRNNLPQILEDEKIDIIFISSVCPETFSYTTSEAISMNVPVACFNLGAPAERVKAYSKGLVIQQLNAAQALGAIVTFVTQQRLKN